MLDKTQISDVLAKRLPDMVVRGVGVVRGPDGRPKVDPGFDLSMLPDDARREVAASLNQEPAE
jgi:hypothetical protein